MLLAKPMQAAGGKKWTLLLAFASKHLKAMMQLFLLALAMSTLAAELQKRRTRPTSSVELRTTRIRAMRTRVMRTRETKTPTKACSATWTRTGSVAKVMNESEALKAQTAEDEDQFEQWSTPDQQTFLV
mmetsp:Transcript_51760/g.120297  ORF Transcript_51760/g.120297 Transcript_51760/m.120297 type:complete len:129 (+) Transcript_51760:451-837(+)